MNETNQFQEKSAKLKAPIPKLPFIIGGIVAGVAAVTVAAVLIFGGGNSSQGGGNNPSKTDHGHSFGAWTIIDTPTCLVAGSEERACECGEKETRSIDKLAHTEIIDDAIAATCTSTGLTEGKHCSVCNEVIVVQKTVEKIAHTYDDTNDADCNVCGETRVVACNHAEIETVPGKAPTCINTGLTEGAKCKKCGETIVAQETIPLAAHTYDNQYDEDCNICSHKRDAECGHFEIETIMGKAPTCTATGLSNGTKCKKCGETIVVQTTIPMEPHTETKVAGKDATCTATGLTEGKKCSVCGTTLIAQQEIEKIAHTYDDKYDETCNGCGLIRDAECAHKETEIVIGYDATCTSTGLTDGAKCKKCGETIVAQETVSVKNHTETIDAAVESTCTSAGLTEGKHCSVCNVVILAQTETAMKPHTEIVVKGVNATCTSTGLTDGKHCSACGGVLVDQEVIPVQDHSYSSSVTPKTCINDASVLYTCDCGNSYTTFVDPIRLSIFWESSSQSTINGYGTFSRNYKVHSRGGYGSIQYKYELFKSSAATTPTTTRDFTSDVYFSINTWGYSFAGENYVIKITAKDNYGNISVYTFGADESILDYKILAGHNETDWIVGKEATKLEDGSRYTKCTICGKKMNEEKLFATGSAGLSFVSYTGGATYSVEGIGECADTDIVIPSFYNGKPVSEISVFAFRGCTSITSISFSENSQCTNIGLEAFQGCTSLVSITIPEGVTSLPVCLFEGCKSLERVIMGNSVASIAVSAFSGCESLISITIPNSVKTIDEYAFDNCTSLESVTFAKGSKVTAIKAGTFSNCTSLTSIEIGDSVTSIGDWAFYNCTGLTSVVIPDSVETIGEYAFASCSNLSEITLGESLRTIGDAAFSRCTGLTSIVIPDSVTSIGGWAFYDCQSLADITYNGTVAKWNAITKGSLWNSYVPATKVTCSDGTVVLK